MEQSKLFHPKRMEWEDRKERLDQRKTEIQQEKHQTLQLRVQHLEQLVASSGLPCIRVSYSSSSATYSTHSFSLTPALLCAYSFPQQTSDSPGILQQIGVSVTL